MHLANARSAFYEPSPSGITFYVNKRGSDIQAKAYIRPKIPNPNEIEFVRLELTVNSRWLDKIGLTKPSDFLMLNFDDLTKQLSWLDLNYAKVQKSDLNVLTGGRWGQIIENEYEYLGAARVITDNRINHCSPRCSKKGDLKECLLTRAHNRGDIGTDAAQAIEDCPHAKKQSKFEDQYFKPSKHADDLNKIMRNAFELWRGTNVSSSIIQNASNTNRRKKKA